MSDDHHEIYERLRAIETDLAAHLAKCDERNKRVDKTLDSVDKTLATVNKQMAETSGRTSARKATKTELIIILGLVANIVVAVAHWVR